MSGLDALRLKEAKKERSPPHTRTDHDNQRPTLFLNSSFSSLLPPSAIVRPHSSLCLPPPPPPYFPGEKGSWTLAVRRGEGKIEGRAGGTRESSKCKVQSAGAERLRWGQDNRTKRRQDELGTLYFSCILVLLSLIAVCSSLGVCLLVPSQDIE
jgi:hypothetical protein